MIKVRVVLNESRNEYRVQVLSGFIFKKWRFLGYDSSGKYSLDSNEIKTYARYMTLASARLESKDYLLYRYPYVKDELKKEYEQLHTFGEMTIEDVIKESQDKL